MMKFKITLIGFLLFSITNLAAAPLEFLTKTLVPETGFYTTTTAFINDFTTTGSLDDSVDRNVPLGFSFPFGGTNYTTVNIVSNGFLRFTTLNDTYFNNSTLTNIDATMPHAIFPYWDDLNPATGGNIRYSTLGSAPNRRFVTTWTNVPHYNVSGSYSFQVVLYENGSIRFRYDASSDANGSSNGGATIGVIENDTKFDQHSFNTAINATQDILYSPPPLHPAVTPNCASPSPQLALTTYNKSGYNHPNNHAQFNTLVTNYAIPLKIFGSGLINNINTPSNSNNNPYGTDSNYLSIIKGYIYAPQNGIYKFGVDGDDAIEVIIDGTVVSGWYGGHGKANTAQNIANINLAAGYHTIEYRHEEVNGGDNYYLYWKTPSQSSLSIVPSNRLFHCPYTAHVSLSKTSVTLSDPINGGANPKAIPGAIIEYTLTAKNSGSAPADNSIIRDSLNTLITTQQYAIWAGGFLTIQTPNLYGGAKTTITDNADSDEGQFINSAGNREVIVNCGTLATGQECVVTYRIIVN